MEVNRRFFDSGLLEIKIYLGDGGAVKIVQKKNGAKRLHPMSGRGSTSLPSRLMQTAHGARAQPTRAGIAVRPYPVGAGRAGARPRTVGR